MTNPGHVRAVPGWTHEDLSELFWHHHQRFWVAGVVTAALALLGTVLFAVGSDLWFLVVPAESTMFGLAVWHRAHARLLTKLRFPGRRVGW